MTDFEKGLLDVEKEKVEAIQAVADALLACAKVQQRDVAYSLGNVAAAIANKE